MPKPTHRLTARCRQQVLKTVLSPKLQELLVETLPHKVVVILLWLAGWSPKRIADEISSMTLADALDVAGRAMTSEPNCAVSAASGWCDIVRGNLGRRVEDLLHENNYYLRERLLPIINATLAKTRVGDFFDANPLSDIKWWCAEVAELSRIARACLGEKPAFARLRADYQEAMEVRIKTSDHGRANLRVVVRKLWVAASQELVAYRASRETVGEFFRYLADLLCRDSFAFERFMFTTEWFDKGKAKGLLKDWMRGMIQKRVFVPSEREDVEQKAWILIAEYLPRYEPERANLQRYATYWTKIAIWRAIPTHGGNEPGPEPETEGPDVEERKPIDDSMPFDPNGVDPWPNPRECAALRRKARIYLRKAFSSGDTPHKNIAFGFKVPLEWKPLEIVDVHWSTNFNVLLDTLRCELRIIFMLEEAVIANLLSPLVEKLRREEWRGKSFALVPAGPLTRNQRAQNIMWWVDDILWKLRRGGDDDENESDDDESNGGVL